MTADAKEWKRQRIAEKLPLVLRSPRLVFLGVSPVDPEAVLVEWENPELLPLGSVVVSRTPDVTVHRHTSLALKDSLVHWTFPFVRYTYSIGYEQDGLPSQWTTRELTIFPRSQEDFGGLLSTHGVRNLGGISAEPADLVFDSGSL